MASKRNNINFKISVKALFKKIALAFIATTLIGLIVLFLFSVIYKSNHKNERTEFGVTYSARQAKKFGLEGDEVLKALLDDMGIKRFRLMSYWDEIEETKGAYDFTELDAQVKEIKARGGVISLTIGLRQPRWPECFMPEWSKKESKDEFRKSLYQFIKVTVNRYKNDPSITSWQLENEFHLDVFGNCPDHERRRLIEEYQLVKSIDNSKPVLMSLSNNYFGLPVGDPRPDQFGVSIYSRVYEGRILKRYISYPFPNWYYAGRAGLTEFLTGRSSSIHELQLEPWGPKDIWEMSLSEQDKSMDINRIDKQLNLAKKSGLKPIDMWGSEWWYWRKNKQNDSRAWDTIKNYVSNNL